jgi:rhomboid protease GluP
MDRESRIFEILQKLGFNTTRLRWKLYQWEKRRENRQKGIQLPASVHWLKYPNKHCLHCGKLVDGDARRCPQCDRRVPSLLTYRIFRLLGLTQPGSAPPTIMVFLAVMVVLFLLEIAMQGVSAVMSPTRFTLLVFGAWNPLLAIIEHQYWRYLGFGLSHIGIIHIGFNCFALMQVGPLVESQIGKSRMLVVITVTQLTAAFASQLWYYNLHGSVHSLTAGASGWLFGLIGFGIALLWSSQGSAKMYRDVLVQWAIYALIFGFFIGANNAAHIGGMAGGAILGFLPMGDTQRTRAIGQVWNAAAIISGAMWCITIAYLAVSIISNWTPGGSPQ